MNKMGKSCPECDYPKDGYPLLEDKSTHYWCYNCNKKYDRKTLEELKPEKKAKTTGIPYSSVLDNIRRHGRAIGKKQ